MPIRYLINQDGSVFDAQEMALVSSALSALLDADTREAYRNENSAAIARHSCSKLLIVSGPGTGKSHLFLQRIKYWLEQDDNANIFVTSFVRKLVADLRKDVSSLPEEQRNRVTVSTLHSLARSVVERNHGTSEWRFAPYFRIIGQSWKKTVWNDVCGLAGQNSSEYSWKEFERQLHEDSLIEQVPWPELKSKYFGLCRFYNAAGFADLIIRARDAFIEDQNLNPHNHFIADEYQDFNKAEDALLGQLLSNSTSFLIVGDDDQVLYEQLKAGRAELIRGHYRNNAIANAMLPFCGRCSFHITSAATHFIATRRNPDCIEKIYLPLDIDQTAQKVQVVACATPSTAVDYVEKFIESHEQEIQERKRAIEDGEAKDPFLLILSPVRDLRFLHSHKARLLQAIERYHTDTGSYSEDYFKLLNYYSIASNPSQNFIFRKVLLHEEIDQNTVNSLLSLAMSDNKNICDLDLDIIRDAFNKCLKIKEILDSDDPLDNKMQRISTLVHLQDTAHVQSDIQRGFTGEESVVALQHSEEEEAEMDELQIKPLSAVELMTIVSSKGLSANHVIILGCDNVNMARVTRNAFFVAMTRARSGLHFLISLQSGGASEAHEHINDLPERHTDFVSYKKTNRIITNLRNRSGMTRYFSSIRLARRH